jgi:laminin alpha 1/2
LTGYFAEKDFTVGKHLELEMEFKTSELNGILLSISEAAGTPSLSIEISDGNVRKISLMYTNHY